MPTDKIYPTNVYWAMIGNVHEVQTEIADIIDQVPFRETSKYLGYANKLTDLRMDILEEFKLEKTKQMIDVHLRHYCTDLNFPFRPYKIYSWFTKNETGDYLQTHHHNDVDITGTYYFQTNGQDGDFFFESPVTAAPHSIVYSNQHTRLFVPPAEGKIILFPGWILHGVLKNTTESTRIGISFNISFER